MLRNYQTFCSEGKLETLIRKEQNSYLANKLQKAKPTINSNCPESFSTFRSPFYNSRDKYITSKYIYK